MVRIKHRYLLVHILYPESADSKSKITSDTPEKSLPHLVQFHRPSPNELTPQLLARAIRDQVLLLYGDYGLGLVSSSLNVKYLSPATSTAIIRCSRDHYRLVWGALAYMTHLPKNSKQAPPRPCVMQVVRTSGTIKKAEQEAIKRARAAILRAKRGGEGSADGLIGLLSQPDAEALGVSGNGKRRDIAGSDVSDEEDEMDVDFEDEGD
ncbi:hypothetical protein OEA41_001567 [Lepraria neglecta]|uniref:Ribonuclease P/MRP protein subunit POP5 n=1 Tax=Lepraria neglecta TaxID=209136 RepID=A0AAD9ZAW5_9LECA|nr:hypothetical protein OEA41_001567 [Lepraria neglecta]